MSYLFSRECPSHEEGLELLREAAEQAGVPVAVESVEVLRDDQAEALGFTGSPTYLAAGATPSPPRGPGTPPGRTPAASTPAGRARGPLPEVADLAEALKAAAATVPA